MPHVYAGSPWLLRLAGRAGARARAALGARSSHGHSRVPDPPRGLRVSLRCLSLSQLSRVTVLYE